MRIEWYPGHMTKAKRAMQDSLKLVDSIIEIRDARIPASSANPDLDALSKGKNRLLILNKADLADPEQNKIWKEHFLKEYGFCIIMDSRERKACADILKTLDRLAAEKKIRDSKRGILSRPMRIMIAGIPNVGKSTLINSLSGKASTKTGDKPGVTKGLQWIRLNPSLELLDTPGILWPKLGDERVGTHLALMGAINADILPAEDLAAYGVSLMKKQYPDALNEKYGIIEEDTRCFLSMLAKKQGLLMKGGEIDFSRACHRFLDDMQKGKIGRITLEHPSPIEIKENNS